MYGSWDVKRDRLNFFVILGYFLLFYPTNNLKNQNFEKMKNIPGAIIILRLCTRNDNDLVYGSWDMDHDRHIFSHFGPLFTLLPP